MRTYSLVFNARSGTFRRVDTKTGKTITTIISRLNSFLKYGNSEITRLKTTPPSRALAVIKKQSSQTRAYINYLQKAIPIARTYLIGYKQILKPKSFNSFVLNVLDKTLLAPPISSSDILFTIFSLMSPSE